MDRKNIFSYFGQMAISSVTLKIFRWWWDYYKSIIFFLLPSFYPKLMYHMTKSQISTLYPFFRGVKFFSKSGGININLLFSFSCHHSTINQYIKWQNYLLISVLQKKCDFLEQCIFQVCQKVRNSKNVSHKKVSPCYF